MDGITKEMHTFTMICYLLWLFFIALTPMTKSCRNITLEFSDKKQEIDNKRNNISACVVFVNN